MHQDPGERSSDPTRDCPGPACGFPGVSGRGVGQWWPAAGLGALSVAVHAWDLLREVAVIFITSTIVWPQENSREGTQFCSVAQACPTLCDPMDCNLPGSIHGILQARILEWVAISFSKGSSRPRDRTRISRIAGSRFTF